MNITSLMDLAASVDLPAQIAAHGPGVSTGIIDWAVETNTRIVTAWNAIIVTAATVVGCFVAFRGGFRFTKALGGAAVAAFVIFIGTGGTATFSNQIKEEIETAPASIVETDRPVL